MGRILLIGVLVIGVLFITLVMSMNKQTVKLPQVFTNDLSSKETQNLSNYALRYALQFATTQHFPETSNFTRVITFNNFFYKYGYIDSIRFNYVPSSSNFKVKAYTRTTFNGKDAAHVATAAIGGINAEGGTGNLAHWHWDGDLLDVSGHNNNGTGYGIRYKNNAIGGSSVDYGNGNGNYITVPDSPSLDLPINFSWSYWGNWNSNPNGWIPFLWKASIPNNPSYRYKPCYGLWLYQDYMHAGVLTSNLEWIEAVSNVTITPQGQWHHMAVTYDGRTVRIYYDGSPVGSATGTGGTIYNSTEPVQIGRIDANGTWVYFKGRMDEFGIYDFVLTPEQVLAIYNSPDGILPHINANPYIVYIKE